MIEEIIGLKEFQLKKNPIRTSAGKYRYQFGKIKAMAEELEPHLKMLHRQTAVGKRSGLEEELKI